MAPALRMTRSIKEKLKIFLRVRFPPTAANLFRIFLLPFLNTYPPPHQSINENATEFCHADQVGVMHQATCSAARLEVTKNPGVYPLYHTLIFQGGDWSTLSRLPVALHNSNPKEVPGPPPQHATADCCQQPRIPTEIQKCEDGERRPHALVPTRLDDAARLSSLIRLSVYRSHTVRKSHIKM
ncbi:MAG: hypothetical protein Q9177_002839 [Variospora cf. flavescens]